MRDGTSTPREVVGPEGREQPREPATAPRTELLSHDLDAAAERPSVASSTLGIVLIGVGVAALLAVLGVGVPVGVVGAVVLVIVGLGVVISGVRGEPLGGALVLAAAVGSVLVVGAAVDLPLGGGIGERVERPTSAAEVADEYRMLMGSLTLDLRDVTLPAGTTTIDVSTGLGEVVVRVPADVAVAVDADVLAGAAGVLGNRVEGVLVDNDRRTPDYDSADRRVDLRVRVALGEADVDR